MGAYAGSYTDGAFLTDRVNDIPGFAVNVRFNNTSMVPFFFGGRFDGSVLQALLFRQRDTTKNRGKIY